MDYLIYYMLVGYAVNNIIGLFFLYTAEDYVEVDIGSFIITIPAWPYTLYQFIAAFFERD